MNIEEKKMKRNNIATAIDDEIYNKFVEKVHQYKTTKSELLYQLIVDFVNKKMENK